MESSVVGKRAAKAHGSRRCFSTQLDHQTRKWNQLIDSPRRHVRWLHVHAHEPGQSLYQ
jgi:hypothetical protein